MICFSTKRGRRRGSRNSLGATVLGVDIAGAATSAAKMNARSGVRAMSSLWLYVPGEGFVRWQEIEQQVHEAYINWRRKKAMEGILIWDFEEAKQYDIALSGQKGAARREWLREWQARHRSLCRLAEIGTDAAPEAATG
jgi:hypothetical protein